MRGASSVFLPSLPQPLAHPANVHGSFLVSLPEPDHDYLMRTGRVYLSAFLGFLTSLPIVQGLN